MSENDRRKVRKEYQSKQDRDKRYQELREKLQKPGTLLKLSIVLGIGLASGIWSLYQIALGTH